MRRGIAVLKYWGKVESKVWQRQRLREAPFPDIKTLEQIDWTAMKAGPKKTMPNWLPAPSSRRPRMS
jgi:hypothetical protein